MTKQRASFASAGEYIEQRYRIDAVIAQGGTSDVHLGYDEPGDRLVAIKILKPADPCGVEMAMRRFEREVTIVAELANEHVVRYEQCGQLPGGQPYLIMEYLDGVDLAEISKYVRDNLRVESVVEWVSQACKGLAPFHARGIVHRDIKPANLYLTKLPGRGPDCIKVLDFTLASRPQELSPSDDAITRTNLQGFSIGYAPREQLFGALGDADTRSDTFALGAVTYRMLTGRRAHVTRPGPRGDEDIEILENMRQRTDPVRLSVLRPDVPRELEAVVMRCLSHDPRMRPADASELLELLRPFRQGSSGALRDREPSARGRVGARMAVAAVALTMIALFFIAVAASAGTTVSAVRHMLPSQ